MKEEDEDVRVVGTSDELADFRQAFALARQLYDRDRPLDLVHEYYHVYSQFRDACYRAQLSYVWVRNEVRRERRERQKGS